jgi:inorganic triphosphatase YgiF
MKIDTKSLGGLDGGFHWRGAYVANLTQSSSDVAFRSEKILNHVGPTC